MTCRLSSTNIEPCNCEDYRGIVARRVHAKNLRLMCADNAETVAENRRLDLEDTRSFRESEGTRVSVVGGFIVYEDEDQAIDDGALR